MKTPPKPIPAIWRIDVEPDEFTPGPNRPEWTGFVTMAALVEKVRGRLADLAGAPVNPSWFFRLDPDIERVYGRPDHVVRQYDRVVEQLARHKDPFGIHVHFYRWNAIRQVAYSDHRDDAWTTHCVDMAVKTFEESFHERPRRTSHGGMFLSDAVVEKAIASGIEVDVTAEPGHEAQTEGATFGAYTTAPSTDYVHYPRRPYYPSRGALGTPAQSKADARPLLMVPLTGYDYARALDPWHRRLVKRLLRWPSRYRPLNPYKPWPHPHTYWDLVMRAADEGEACYVALAIRTDGPSSRTATHARPLFEYLHRHPIAKRLRFVDPLSPEIAALTTAQKASW